MEALDLSGRALPGLAAALAAASRNAAIAAHDEARTSARDLVPLPWFPFDVVAAPGCRRAAARIARRAEHAYWLLRRVLGVAPRVRLAVLDRPAWQVHAGTAEFGVMHVGRDGTLVAASEPAIAWTAVSRWLARHLHAGALAPLLRACGTDARTGGPALDDLAESLVAHEMAHLLCEQQRVEFPRLWLGELFANYALVAVLADTDPAGARRLRALADAAATLRDAAPSLDAFEARFGRMAVVPSVLGQLALTRAAQVTHAEAGVAPLARLFRAFHARGALRAFAAAPRDADAELGRLIAEHVHPALGDMTAYFPAAPLARAA
jgi:hypothetical protein